MERLDRVLDEFIGRFIEVWAILDVRQRQIAGLILVNAVLYCISLWHNGRIEEIARRIANLVADVRPDLNPILDPFPMVNRNGSSNI